MTRWSPEAYWTMSPADVAAQLHAPAEGLSSAEAGRRLAEAGPNEISERERFTRFGVLWNQMRSPLLLLLLVAAGLSVVTGEWIDAVIILAIVVASVGIGYTREYRAQSAAEQLRARVQVHASVLRDGKPRPVPITEVVPATS